MRRPWQIWLGFFSALALVAAGVGWLSFRALESDHAEEVARQRAAVEEDVRLALWRMDSLMSAFVAQESSRTAGVYQPFVAVRPTELDATRADRGASASEGARLSPVPSPLLSHPAPQIFVYFQWGADGSLTSPQVPTGSSRNRAVPGIVTAEQAEKYEQRLARLESLINFDELLASLPVPDVADDPALPPNWPLQNGQANATSYAELPAENELRQQVLSVNEYRRRSNFVVNNNSIAQGRNLAANGLFFSDEPLPAGSMTPRVIAGELLLARTVSVGGKNWLQGCWIDWETLRGELQADIADLLPQANLRLVVQPPESEQTRMLAALPVQIDPGTVPLAVASGLSPVRQSLVVAWGAMLLAALAVAVLLRGVVALSERRADFVSAVTHELRTPLTTFRMYAEMLAEGMIPDEAARRQYLGTLRIEADRLSHLVENVLAYARLERGGLGNRIQPVPGEDLLKLATGRLGERAGAAGLALTLTVDTNVAQATVLCDASAVEQILFNLVDNACKYAARAANKTLELDAQAAEGKLNLRVRDYGPGISIEQRRRLFQPFRKSADEAARSAPGVGLGLSLSRRLACDMGGDLQFDAATMAGAAFVVSLPLRR